LVLGSEYCNCFGKFDVPIHFVVIFDCMVIFGLAAVNVSNVLSLSSTKYLVVGQLFLVLLFSGIFVLNNLNTKSFNGIQSVGNRVYVNPNDWISEELEKIEIDFASQFHRFENGKIVLARGNCTKCKNILGSLNSEKSDILFVIFPPTQPLEERLQMVGFQYIVCNGTKRWICPTPTILTIKNGVVESVE